MAVEVGLGLMGVGVGLGLRHGIDWDHIAAITDITSTQPSRLRGFVMGSLYALGHAAVVVTLGLLALLAASRLPASVDRFMETIVGITLVLLAAWVFWSLFRDPKHFHLRSRWMLVFMAVGKLFRWARSRTTGNAYEKAAASPSSYGPVASTGIGMIHGIGAETGSQALLIASAAGATTSVSGSFLLIAFVVGLVISNSLITIGTTMGVLGSQARRFTYLAVGVLIGSFSLVVGTLFLMQKSSVLPGFFA